MVPSIEIGTCLQKMGDLTIKSSAKLILQLVSTSTFSRFNYKVDRVDINESVAPQSNSTQKGFQFKKGVPITIVPEMIISFLSITYALPTATSLGSGGDRAPSRRWHCS